MPVYFWIAGRQRAPNRKSSTWTAFRSQSAAQLTSEHFIVYLKSNTDFNFTAENIALFIAISIYMFSRMCGTILSLERALEYCVLCICRWPSWKMMNSRMRLWIQKAACRTPFIVEFYLVCKLPISYLHLPEAILRIFSSKHRIYIDQNILEWNSVYYFIRNFVKIESATDRPVSHVWGP